MIQAVKKKIKYLYGYLLYAYSLILSIVRRRDWTKFLTYRIYWYIQFSSIKAYKNVKKKAEDTTVKLISKHTKIRIAFIVYSNSMWFFDELYKLLENNERFEVSIIVGHFIMNSKESSNHEYDKTVEYLKNQKKYRIVSPDEVSKYDVLFYLTPFDFSEDYINLVNIPLSKLVLHVSYSYMLSGNNEKLSTEMYHWAYRYYTDSQYYFEKISTTIKRYSGNARYYGFPKMDQFYHTPEIRVSEKKIIIFAPHHSVNYKNYKSATFELNYMFFLELAEKYKNDVVWVYKPHPLLKDHCIEAAIFRNSEEYNEYLEKLVHTGNVIIAESGEYFSLFKGSDAMITDSVSFLAEYQFTGKPLLLLMSGQEQYNEFGESIVDILYKCSGDEFEKIEKFVNNIISGIDTEKNKRQAFFEKNLSYYSRNRASANMMIYKDINSTFEFQK